MKKLLVVLISIAILTNFAGCKLGKNNSQPSQEINTTFANSYNFAQFQNSTNGDVLSLGETSLAETENSVVITGTFRKTDSSDTDIFVAKGDTKGNINWAKALGTNLYEESPRIKSVEDGYILIFESCSLSGGSPVAKDFKLIKFDKAFNVQWKKVITLNNPYLTMQSINVTQTSDEGHAILFNNSEDVYPESAVVKVSKSGEIDWEKDFNEHMVSLESEDNGIALLTATGLSNFTFKVVKLDTKGSTLWAKEYALKDYNKTIAIRKSKDGGYFIVGFGTYEPSKNGSGIVIVNGKETFKTTDGSLLRTEIDAGIGGRMLVITAEHMECMDVETLLKSFPEGYPTYGIFVIKIDSEGNKEWSKVFGQDFIYPVHSIYYVDPLLPTDDGCIVPFTVDSSISTIGGPANCGLLTFRLDNMGNIKWAKIFEEEHGEFYSSISIAKGGFIISGEHTLIKIDNDGNIGGNCVNLAEYKINLKDLYTSAKSINISSKSSNTFFLSPVNLEITLLDPPEVKPICSKP